MPRRRSDHDGRSAGLGQDDHRPAKLAKRFSERDKRKVLMASLDTRRPAAQEQLRQLGQQAGIDTLPIIAGQLPVEIAGARSMQAQARRLRHRHPRHRGPHPYRRSR
jgi:hypothetical protein